MGAQTYFFLIVALFGIHFGGVRSLSTFTLPFGAKILQSTQCVFSPIDYLNKYSSSLIGEMTNTFADAVENDSPMQLDAKPSMSNCTSSTCINEVANITANMGCCTLPFLGSSTNQLCVISRNNKQWISYYPRHKSQCYLRC